MTGFFSIIQTYEVWSLGSIADEQVVSIHPAEDSILYSEVEDALGRYFRVLDADMQRHRLWYFINLDGVPVALTGCGMSRREKGEMIETSQTHQTLDICIVLGVLQAPVGIWWIDVWRSLWWFDMICPLEVCQPAWNSPRRGRFSSPNSQLPQIVSFPISNTKRRALLCIPVGLKRVTCDSMVIWWCTMMHLAFNYSITQCSTGQAGQAKDKGGAAAAGYAAASAVLGTHNAGVGLLHEGMREIAVVPCSVLALLVSNDQNYTWPCRHWTTNVPVIFARSGSWIVWCKICPGAVGLRWDAAAVLRFKTRCTKIHRHLGENPAYQLFKVCGFLGRGQIKNQDESGGACCDFFRAKVTARRGRNKMNEPPNGR